MLSQLINGKAENCELCRKVADAAVLPSGRVRLRGALRIRRIVLGMGCLPYWDESSADEFRWTRPSQPCPLKHPTTWLRHRFNRLRDYCYRGKHFRACPGREVRNLFRAVLIGEDLYLLMAFLIRMTRPFLSNSYSTFRAVARCLKLIAAVALVNIEYLPLIFSRECEMARNRSTKTAIGGAPVRSKIRARWQVFIDQDAR